MPEAGTAEPGDLWRILFRRKALIAAITAACLAAAVVYLLVTPPQYKATAQILIDPRNKQIVTKDVNPDALSPDGGVLQVESQSRVIESDAVLLRAIATAGLDRDNEFGLQQPTIVDAFAALFSGSRSATGSQNAAIYQALRLLRKNLTIKRADKVFVVDVVVSAKSSEKAARIADAIAEAYVADQIDERSRSSVRASDALSGRLAELRGAVQAAERRVEAYRSTHDLGGTDKQLVTDQQLDNSGAKLGDARARTAELRARSAQIETWKKSGADTSVLPEALQSTVIIQLRSSYGEQLRREADLRTRVGDRHPDLIAAVAQTRGVKQQIDAEVDRVVRAARIDYDRALASEKSLAGNLDESKKATFAADDASIELREMTRERDAKRALYDTFLARSAETRAQADVDSSNARIISKAVPPDRASWPLAGFILLGALGAGLGVGAALAFVLEYRSPAILSPGQLRAAAQAPVIGILLPRQRGSSAGDQILAMGLNRLCGPLASLRAAPRPHSVLLTSTATDGAERSAVADRLVEVAADCGVAALVVQADLAQATTSAEGLLDILRGQRGLRETAIALTRDVAALPIGTVSQPDFDELSETAIERFLRHAGRYFDVIVFDAGALEHDPRLAPLARSVDDVVLVAVRGVTPQRRLTEAADAVNAMTGRPVSAALLVAKAA